MSPGASAASCRVPLLNAITNTALNTAQHGRGTAVVMVRGHKAERMHHMAQQSNMLRKQQTSAEWHGLETRLQEMERATSFTSAC